MSDTVTITEPQVEPMRSSLYEDPAPYVEAAKSAQIFNMDVNYAT